VKRLFVVSSIGLWVLGLVALPAHAEAPVIPVILVFGDSISAGYGLEHADQGWVGLLRTKLKDSGYETQVVNASVSGETTAGGLSRLPRALNQHHPQIVILELGGNDGLRALPVEQLRTNLERMVGLAQAAGARVLLLGIRIPPNYGPEYTDKFFAVYGQVAEAEKIPLVPFLLDGIALSPSLMQADGIHPNQAGQPRLLANIWPALEPLLPHPNR
jgi:acyl-CoA thioesterase-1